MIKATFCLDIGGTKTAWALYGEDGTELKYVRFPTEPERGPEDLIARIAASAKAELENVDVTGACVASPGPLDVASGRIVHIVTMGWADVPLVAMLKSAFGFDFKLINDCDAGALGVAYKPEFRHYKNVCYVSLSTGVGGGIVIGGKSYSGVGNAGDFGHMPIPKDGIKCGCGRTDCLEVYASGSGMENRYFAVTGKKRVCLEIEKLAKGGDPVASAIFCDANEALRIGGQLINATLNPEVIIIGGSVARAGEILTSGIASEQNVAFAQDDGKQVLYGAYVYANQD